jgi:hypothetical protein
VRAQARPFVRSVAALFDAYLQPEQRQPEQGQPEQGKHARVV